MTGFYGMTLFATLFGNFDSISTYTAQLVVGGDPRRINQLLRQAIITSLILLIGIVVPCSFLLPGLMRSFAVSEEVIALTLSLTSLMYASMLLRTVGDSMRGMLQGMGYMTSLGFANLLNIAFFIPYSTYLMTSMDDPLTAYTLSLTIYETLGLLQCFFFYFFVLDQKYRDLTFPSFDKYGWYFWETLKTIMASCYSWVAYEAIMLILTMTHSPI